MPKCALFLNVIYDAAFLTKFVSKAQLEVSALRQDVASVKTMDETMQVWGLLEMLNSKPLLVNLPEGGQACGLKLIR